MDRHSSNRETLLAVDLGIRAGLALYRKTDGLQWFRSRNYGKKSRMKRAADRLLRTTDGLEYLFIEGGGRLLHPWLDSAERLEIESFVLSAEVWRGCFLLPREKRNGLAAKETAIKKAREIIKYFGLSNPRQVRHDAAEAVLVGLWGMLELNWLEEVPECLVR